MGREGSVIGKGMMGVSGGIGNVLFLDLDCGYMGCTFFVFHTFFF